mgnify:CR=1 FL=1
MCSMKSLIIAEKPSVANLIADALSISKNSKKADFFENDRFIVTSAQGHIVEYEKPKQKWNLAKDVAINTIIGAATAGVGTVAVKGEK